MANPNNGINGNGGGNGIPNNNNNNGDNNNNNNNNDNNNNNNANGNNGNNNANNHGNNNDNINGNNNGNIYGNNNGNNNANHGNNAIGNNNGNALALGAEARPKPINDDLLRLTNGLDKVPVKRVLDLCSQLGITTAEILATTAKQEAVCGAITRSLAVNEQIIWGVLCERATAVRNSPVKVDMVELSGLLANMTRKYGSPPDASLITSRASILTKMKKIDEALTMDIMELHPNRESKSANRSTINISENNQLVTEEETPKGKARDFSEFSICFMRWAVMLCTIHPMSSNADTCQTSGASLIDLIIYWRRLADLLAPLTMDHLVQYDSDYRRRVAIMIAGESTTLSEALRQDVAPTVLSSALATAAMAAAAATKKNNDSKPTKTQKAPKSNDACYHFLRGSCRRGNSCRFVHDTQEQKRRRSTPAFGQRSEPYDRQSQHEPKSSWSSYASPKDSPSSAEASRKAKSE